MSQGCNGSIFIFLIITYLIIEHLETVEECFTDDGLKIPVLLYADDGLLLTYPNRCATNADPNDRNSPRHEINKAKSNILMFSAKNPPDEMKI